MHPDKRKSNRSCQDVRIARCLPIDVREDDLMDEWKLLHLENDEKGSKEQRIDIFWKQASMSEKTLNTVLTVKDALTQYKNNSEYVPITKHEKPFYGKNCTQKL
ncbi:hypothetical protein PR048_007077 [Dryococelus australis]|uniref:Uncharacterized protein n=1 Tax=Dryococelus australis TaxID=614101 RepID=A0ABQ9ICM1_9NEOP|nr:hypothetical protein PR048_007077 [Dryococelus australis]